MQWVENRIASAMKCMEDKVMLLLGDFVSKTGRMDMEGFRLSVNAYVVKRKARVQAADATMGGGVGE